MEVIAAAELLLNDFGISSDIYSATSITELARNAAQISRENRLNGQRQRVTNHVEKLLEAEKPIVAANDYVRAFPQQISVY